MYCLKCGKDTQGEQVFCENCLQVMDAYPVKPDTAIHLPKRSTQSAPKKPVHRKKVISGEEQVAQLKTANRRLRLTVACLVLALGVCIGALVYRMLQPQPETNTNVGKNYTYSPD